MSDRVFTIAFGVSLGAHLVLLAGHFLSLDWFQVSRSRPPLEVIYEYVIAEREVRELEERLIRAQREAAASFSPAPLGERTEIRIPDRPSLTAGQTLEDLLPERSSFVDLTNLVEASRGDPVLLSYFSAIREQIQQTANRRAWLAGEATQGIVYVAFVLTAGGTVHSLEIVPQRSAESRELREIALRIVTTAAPFPPFPPSIGEPSKAIVVPLEFLLSS